MDYRYGSHTVHKIKYHFVWVTKYRYQVLQGDVGQRVRELVRQRPARRSRSGSSRGRQQRSRPHPGLGAHQTGAKCNDASHRVSIPPLGRGEGGAPTPWRTEEISVSI